MVHRSSAYRSGWRLGLTEGWQNYVEIVLHPCLQESSYFPHCWAFNRIWVLNVVNFNSMVPVVALGDSQCLKSTIRNPANSDSWPTQPHFPKVCRPMCVSLTPAGENSSCSRTRGPGPGPGQLLLTGSHRNHQPPIYTEGGQTMSKI